MISIIGGLTKRKRLDKMTDWLHWIYEVTHQEVTVPQHHYSEPQQDLNGDNLSLSWCLLLFPLCLFVLRLCLHVLSRQIRNAGPLARLRSNQSTPDASAESTHVSSSWMSRMSGWSLRSFWPSSWAFRSRTVVLLLVVPSNPTIDEHMNGNDHSESPHTPASGETVATHTLSYVNTRHRSRRSNTMKL